jgi:hypothetical protein
MEWLTPPPAEQPVATNAAAANEASAKGKILSCVLESIKYILSNLVLFQVFQRAKRGTGAKHRFWHLCADLFTEILCRLGWALNSALGIDRVSACL